MSFPSAYYGYYGDPWQRETPPCDGLRWMNQVTTESLRVNVVGPFAYVSFSLTPLTIGNLAWQSQFTYCGGTEGGKLHAGLGSGWFLSDFPTLVQEVDSKGSVIHVNSGSAHRCTFRKDGRGGWKPESGHHAVLEHDTVDRSFIFTADGLTALIFHNFDPGLPRLQRGALKAIESLTDDTIGVIEEHHAGRSKKILFRHLDSNIRIVYLIEPHATEAICWQSATLLKDEQAIERALFGYHHHSAGGLRLQSIRHQKFDGSWHDSHTINLQYQNHGIQSVETNNPNTGSDIYKIRYLKNGDVKSIHHQGAGEPPRFYL